MRKLLALFPLVAVLAYAEPPDVPALPDAGSLVTPAIQGDGGYPAFVTVNTAITTHWTAAIKCNTGPAVHYRFSADAATATTANNVLEADMTFDLPVWQGSAEKYQWLSLLGEDGGAPSCNVFRNPLR